MRLLFRNDAVHPLNDGWLDAYDCGVVVGNDSDVAEAMRLVRQHRGKRIGLVTPGTGRPYRQLMAHADFSRHVSAERRGRIDGRHADASMARLRRLRIRIADEKPTTARSWRLHALTVSRPTMQAIWRSRPARVVRWRVWIGV